MLKSPLGSKEKNDAILRCGVCVRVRVLGVVKGIIESGRPRRIRGCSCLTRIVGERGCGGDKQGNRAGESSDLL